MGMFNSRFTEKQVTDALTHFGGEASKHTLIEYLTGEKFPTGFNDGARLTEELRRVKGDWNVDIAGTYTLRSLRRERDEQARIENEVKLSLWRDACEGLIGKMVEFSHIEEHIVDGGDRVNYYEAIGTGLVVDVDANAINRITVDRGDGIGEVDGTLIKIL